MKKKNILAFGAGIIILAYIIHSLDPEKIFAALLNTRIEYFILAGLFYFLNDVVAAISLKIITSTKISIKDALISHMCGMLYSNATPGRVGYYYTSLSIAKKTKTSKSGNIGILTLFQGINFLMKVILCLLAVVYFSSYIIDERSQRYLLIASVLPIIGVILIILALYTNISNRIICKIPVLNKSIEYIHRMQETVRAVKADKIMKLIILALFGWVFMSAQWYFLAASIGLDISYLTTLMLQPLISTVMFVPISPSGLGLAEGGTALLFNAIGLTAANGVAFMLLVRINSIMVDLFGIIDMKIHKKD